MKIRADYNYLLSCIGNSISQKYPHLFLHNFDHFNLCDTYYDLFLTSIVTDYYKLKIKEGFYSYFKNFVNTDHKNLFPTQVINNYIKEVENEISSMNIKLDPEWKIAGDIHAGILKVKSKNKIIYKNLINEMVVTNTLSEELLAFKEILPTYKEVDGITLRNYVAVKNNNINLDKFYFNIGKLLSLALFFRIIDLNAENIIIKDNQYPFAFDLECMLTPKIKRTRFDIQHTGILLDQLTDNHSAILGGYYKVFSYLKPIIYFENRTKPKIVWKTLSKGYTQNKPLNLFEHPYKYINNITRGFEFGNKILINNKYSIVEKLNNTKASIRILLRPTRVYKFIQNKFSYPNIYTKQNVDKVIERELKKSKYFNIGSINDKKLLNYEKNELLNYFIPLFYSKIDDNNIYTSKNEVIGTLTETPLNGWKNHLKSYDKFSKTQELKLVKILEKNYKQFVNSKSKINH